MLNVNLNRKPPWSSGVAYKILSILGGSDKTMIVGGAVRDWLCDFPVGDIDFATKLLPKESMQALLDHGFNVKPIGIDHGTITVYKGKNSYEITSLRKDIITDGRHAKVIFGGTWQEDAERRDFTVNALYSDEYGSVLDATGHGFRDLEGKKLKFIGSPENRIKEDNLRILRYFRFLSKFPINIDKDSMASCIKYAINLKNLSSERLLLEFNKILMSENANLILNIMIENKVMTNLFSSTLIDNFSLEKRLLNRLLLTLREAQNKSNYTFILYISFVINYIGQKESNKSKILSSVLKKFKLSNNDKKFLYRNIHWLSNHKNISKASIIKLWLDFGELEVRHLSEILLIANKKIGSALLSSINNSPPDFPIKGSDLKNIGLKEGIEIGKILQNIRDWWIAEDCLPTKSQCLLRVKKYSKL
jgi:poly(A) polymerase